jgi:hypothetical protein
MLIGTSTQQRQNAPQGDYLQDDIARGLRASLVEVLSCTLADEGHPDFLKGVLSLARRQAGLYGIPWHDMIKSLCTMPELCGLISHLQECALTKYASWPTSPGSQPSGWTN